MAPSPPSDESLSLTKACNPCRLLKTRCVIETGLGQKRCQRCIKIGKDCTFPAVQRRKQRKRTDVRVADLENEIRSMKGLISQNQSNDNPQRGKLNGISAASSMDTTSEVALNDTNEVCSHHSPYGQGPDESNTPDPGAISDTLAEELYNTYRFDLVEHYPLVSFREDYSVRKLRVERSTLFLAVMAGAARKSHPQLSTVLNKKVLQSYATRVFMNSEKSLELVQAMIITVVWYSPPEGSGSDQHKFYEYIHMAATMALDLGLGSKSSEAEGSAPAGPHFAGFQQSSTNIVEQVTETSGLENEQPSLVSQEPESSELDNESMRTRLSCFVLCCGVALSMRRPNMLKYNDWVARGVKHFQTSMSVSLSDRRLVAWVQLLKIADDISTGFSLDDLEHIAKITYPNSPKSLKKFEKRLQDWRADLAPGILNGSLELCYHYLGIFLHEIALYDAHSPQDFAPPFSVEKIRSHRRCSDPNLPNQGAILHCITSAHALVETFLHMDIESLRTLPIFFYVRLWYAMFILEILTNDASGDPSGSMTRHSIQANSYLTLLIKHLKEVVATMNHMIPCMFLDIFITLRKWHEQNAASPTVWLGAESQGHVPSEETSAATEKSQPSAQLGLLGDGDLNSTGSFNNGGNMTDNMQGSNVMTPNTGWTSSAYFVATPSQTAAPHSNTQYTNPTFSSLPNRWNAHVAQLDPPAEIESNFDLSGEMEMDFDPSNLFLFNGATESMHADKP